MCDLPRWPGFAGSRNRYRIFCEGDDCAGVYVVDEGLVRIFKTGVRAARSTSCTWSARAEPLPRVAGHRRIQISRKAPRRSNRLAASFCHSTLSRKSLEEDHDLCLCMMAGITSWVHDLVGLMGNVWYCVTRSGRVARYLLEMATDEKDSIELPALKRHIANHLKSHQRNVLSRPPTIHPNRLDLRRHKPTFSSTGPRKAQTNRQGKRVKRAVLTQ